jgi:hypothetical protein
MSFFLTVDQIHSDGGYFRINQTTGEITISKNLDREMNATHKPIVYARDNGDNILSSSVTVTISVNDINDNPTLFPIWLFSSTVKL